MIFLLSIRLPPANPRFVPDNIFNEHIKYNLLHQQAHHRISVSHPSQPYNLTSYKCQEIK